MPKFYLTLLFFLITITLVPVFVFASTTDGTIDSTYKYAWSNNMGWLNFGTSGGNVHVTNSALTGYVWSDNYGWIDLAPTKSGVENNVSGTLSGYAWGENVDWINFSGVTINCSGKFAGTATGDIAGTINFDCTDCKILTDWRPSSGCGGGGGSFCGDAACDGNETCATCPADCGICQPVCGDGTCESSETCSLCPSDCGACLPQLFCGDETCNGNEDCESCPSDCGVCQPPPICGDEVCNGDETCRNCSDDCGKCPPVFFCGDGICRDDETCANCHIDCGICQPVCGDRRCDTSETCDSCPVDCGACLPQLFCGDGVCSENENCESCSSDCGICGSLFFCGDGTCNGEENCTNCFSDCGVCPPPPICGDGTCNGDETCKNCSDDCGKCVIEDIIIPIITDPVVTKVISTTGVAITTIATVSSLFVSPFSLPELFLIPMRLFGLLLVAFGWKKRSLPWGVVYDSVTKQPLDPAYVVLKNLQGKNVSSAITDLDGRYGFLVGPGIYKIMVNKTNYAFPSQKLVGKIKDEIYENLYFGEEIESKKGGEVIAKNIPLDPIKFDWNEFVKKNRGLMRFYSKWDLMLRKISDLFFIVGFVFAIIAFFAAPYPYNTIILCLYLFLLLLRILGVKPKPLGYVVDKINGTPLSFAILRIMMPNSDIQVSHKITDRYGRYYCLMPKGQYYVKIENKNDDGSYSLVYTSPIVDTSKKGIIKERFEV